MVSNRWRRRSWPTPDMAKSALESVLLMERSTGKKERKKDRKKERKTKLLLVKQKLKLRQFLSIKRSPGRSQFPVSLSPLPIRWFTAMMIITTIDNHDHQTDEDQGVHHHHQVQQ